MKKEIKKSLSLFLAVIMLLSSWVWVAPEKASAVATPYYVKIVSNVTDTGNENSSTLVINYTDSNGKGSAGSKTVSFGQMSWDGSSTIFSGTIDGWPTSFTWSWSLGGGRSEYHENITFYIGATEDTCTTQLWKDSYNFKNALIGTDYLKLSATLGGTKPAFTTITDMSVTDVTVNKLPNGAAVSSTVKVTGGKDQYGVEWKASLPTTGFSYSLKNGETALSSTYGSISGSSNSTTATIYDDIQKLFPNANSGKIYAYVTYGSSTKSMPINLTFGTYDTTFDANGGQIGPNENAASETTKITGKKYGEVIGNSPAYRSKAGFEFDGFYSVKNADATGLAASFSGTKFKDSETAIDAVGDSTWYAAWKATPITATFMTADNQLIGTVEGRYNNYLTASNMYNGDAGLNAAVKAAYTGNKIQFNGNNEPIYKDGSTTYTFAGWKIIESDVEALVDGTEDTVLTGDVTFQAVYTKADAAKYTVSFEDGAGNVIASKNDYLYRDAVTGVPSSATKAQDDRYTYEFIGWAKKLANVNFFAVDQYDCDNDGVKIVYTSKDTPSFVVKGNETYVPVFRMTDREYKVTYSYMVDGGTTETTVIEGYNWEDTPVMPEIKDNYTAGGYRYYIDGWMVGADANKKQLDNIKINGDLLLTATYGAGIPAEYTINFYGKAEDGETNVLLEDVSGIYEHNSTVTAPTVAQTIDTADSLYTFAGWSPAVNTTATADADYYATYTKKDYADLHFYNYDGTLIYELDGKENTLFVGETIPEYSNIDEETNENVLPTKETDVVGSYKFIGWKDGNGNDVVPGTTKFDGDTYLYAQFETEYTNYTVKFVDDDGSVILEEEYHYGDPVVIPAEPEKAMDATYEYDFRAWSPDVSEVCYGNATYTATYRRTYRYYKVTWLTDDKTTVVSQSNYINDAKIQQGIVNAPVTYAPAETGKTWAFKHWVQCDENGNDVLVDGKQVIFKRGDRMPGKDLYFYPVFEQVANVLTVKFYKEDGTTLIGEAKVPYGKALAECVGEYEAEVYKSANETHHYAIDKWVNVNGGADVTNVTADVSVKPFYKETEHTKDKDEVLVAPTCTETGLKNVTCSADECDKIWTNVIIDMVPDTGKPAGQIYVGADLWKSTDTVDYADVKYIAPNTQLVVNAQDTGSGSEPWNNDGKLNRGVGKIEFYIAKDKIEDTSTLTTGWTEIYNYEAKKQEVFDEVLANKGITVLEYVGYSSNPTPANKAKKAEIDNEVAAVLAGYKANATGIASNLNFVNGEEYVIYIRISDREVDGNCNSIIFSSGKIAYGTVAPEIAVSGNGYGTKFCAEATVTVTDDTDGVKAYLDGGEVTLTEGKFTCNTKGVHTVTAIDKNGNKTTKTFEIKGNHTYRNYTIGATCENAGSRYDICTVCGEKANEAVIPALGHSYTANYTEKDPTCVVDGYRTYICDNNCGTKLVLNPTDAADVLAAAKKWVDGEDGAEGSWVSLTAADLKHLKATGTHTYAKVKDEDGNDTEEDAWVIDKVPTCTVTGSKHKDCIKCGLAEARVTEVIPVDTVNGHKFYREKVTKEPTCTEKGEKSKTCRYCGDVVVTGYIDALGHVAGEYEVTLEPTCTAKGSKVLKCGRCDVKIGEADKDGKYNTEAPVAVEIPALGHAWKLDGEIWQATETNEEAGIEEGKWYQSYVCGNDASHKEIKEVEGYKPPVAATVTFDFNGGYYVIPAVGNENEVGYVPPIMKGTQQISAFVGDFIAASEVETALKQNNATKTYAFSHWADADGKEVKFPVEVKGDATYYAVYTEKFVNYTITYYEEDGSTEYKKTGYLHNGEEITLADGPKKSGDWQYTYKFAGWKVIGSDTEVVYTDKVTISGANLNLKATYSKVLNKYAVTYAYSKNDILETFAVNAGEAARDCAITPVKESNTKYHYEFSEWNKAEQLASVESNIYTTPNFTASEHEYNVTVKSAATCTENRVDTYSCKNCEYSYDKEIEGTALNHILGDPVYNEETGKNVVTCTREGCGESLEDTRTFTAKFFINADDAKAIKTISFISWGTTIAATKLPADPTKASDATNDYKFAGWAVKGTTTVVNFAELEIKADAEFVAIFTSTTRKYSVVFAYDGNNPIEVITDVSAGATVSFGGEAPTKDFDATYHYAFEGWYVKGDANKVVVDPSTVTIDKDYTFYAKFEGTKHSYTESELTSATCTTGKGTRYTCACGKYYDVTGKPLDHVFAEIKRVEPANGQDGYIEYKCNNCTETKKETLEWVDDKVVFTVIVLDQDGNPVSGATVQAYVKGALAIEGTSDNSGKATFTLKKGETYSFKVYGASIDTGVTVEKKVDGSETTLTIRTSTSHCSCTCHRDGLWPTIFRFFHKIIKSIVGEFKCCNDPDAKYFN